MYRDEQEALKARRDALKRETAEVDAHLKAIKNHRENTRRGAVRTPIGFYITAFMIGLNSMILLVSLDVQSYLQKQANVIDQDASACEEHGVPVIPQSSEDADQTLQSTAADCDGADNDCDTANDNGLDIIFVLDTSGSMSSYLEDVKRTISAYAKDATAASYTLMTTETDNWWLGAPFLTHDRQTFISLVSQSRINPSVEEEYIPLRMEMAANLGHNMVIAFTDEPPMVPTDRYYDYVVNRRRGLYGLCARNNNATFAVFTTPQNVAAWREGGSCIRVYGEL